MLRHALASLIMYYPERHDEGRAGDAAAAWVRRESTGVQSRDAAPPEALRSMFISPVYFCGGRGTLCRGTG